MITDYKIQDWNNPITAEADRPQRSASDMKAVFDSNANQIRDQFNSFIDELSSGAGDVFLANDGTFKTPSAAAATNGVKEGGVAGDIYVKASDAVFDAGWKSPASMGLLSNVDGDTPTTLNGILTGDGKKVGSVTTLPVNKGGTGATTAQGARTALGASNAGVWPIAMGGTGATTAAAARSALGVVNSPNLNLLINPDFRKAFFINQRGKESYSGIGYTGDCWKINNASGVVTIGDNGLTMSASGSACYFCQWLERDLTGEQMTLSCIENGSVHSKSGVISKQASLSMEMPSGVQLILAWDSGKSLYRTYFSIGAGESTTVSKVKLEKGSVSTIDIDAPADRATELVKCQRFFNRIAAPAASEYAILIPFATVTNSGSLTCLVPLPVTMRTNPTISIGGDIHFFKATGTSGNSTKISAITPGGVMTHGVYCSMTTAASITSGSVGDIRTNGDPSAYIDFSADF